MIINVLLPVLIRIMCSMLENYQAESLRNWAFEMLPAGALR